MIRELVARDESGKPYTVRYEAVNAMLLNEFLKEHHKVEAQDKKIGELEAAISEMKAALKAQGAQIQKVGVQAETAKSAARLVSSNE